MLTKLILQDFQVHKRLKILLDKHVTCIIGRNDRGKSAIIRAFRQIALNQPRGSGAIRRGAKRFKIVLFADGHKVGRVRGKKTNLYYHDSIRFAAFGTSKVPDACARRLNIGEINFQDQLDPPFWFLETAGSVSKKLNVIVNLGSIDKAMDTIGKKVRKAKSTATVTEDRLAEAKTSLSKMKWVVEMDEDFRQVEKAKERADRIANKRRRLSDLVQRVKGLTDRKNALLRASSDGEEVVRLGELAVKRRDESATLSDLLAKLKRAERMSTMVVPDMSEVHAANIEMHKAAEDRRLLEEMLEQLREALKWQQEKESELHKAEKAKTALIRTVSGKRCPTCGQKVKTGHTHPSSPSQRRIFISPKKPR